MPIVCLWIVHFVHISIPILVQLLELKSTNFTNTYKFIL